MSVGSGGLGGLGGLIKTIQALRIVLKVNLKLLEWDGLEWRWILIPEQIQKAGVLHFYDTDSM